MSTFSASASVPALPGAPSTRSARLLWDKGIAEFVEVARWKLRMEGRDADGYKLNNSYRAIWSGRLVAEHPELATMFEIRARRAA